MANVCCVMMRRKRNDHAARCERDGQRRQGEEVVSVDNKTECVRSVKVKSLNSASVLPVADRRSDSGSVNMPRFNVRRDVDGGSRRKTENCPQREEHIGEDIMIDCFKIANRRASAIIATAKPELARQNSESQISADDKNSMQQTITEQGLFEKFNNQEQKSHVNKRELKISKEESPNKMTEKKLLVSPVTKKDRFWNGDASILTHPDDYKNENTQYDQNNSNQREACCTVVGKLQGQIQKRSLLNRASSNIIRDSDYQSPADEPFDKYTAANHDKCLPKVSDKQSSDCSISKGHRRNIKSQSINTDTANCNH